MEPPATKVGTLCKVSLDNAQLRRGDLRRSGLKRSLGLGYSVLEGLWYLPYTLFCLDMVPILFALRSCELSPWLLRNRPLPLSVI